MTFRQLAQATWIFAIWIHLLKDSLIEFQFVNAF